MKPVPVLGYAGNDRSEAPFDRLIVGMDDLTLDGEPFPWPTIGDWTVTFSDDGIAKLTVSIAVTLPKDPGS